MAKRTFLLVIGLCFFLQTTAGFADSVCVPLCENSVRSSTLSPLLSASVRESFASLCSSSPQTFFKIDLDRAAFDIHRIAVGDAMVLEQADTFIEKAISFVRRYTYFPVSDEALYTLLTLAADISFSFKYVSSPVTKDRLMLAYNDVVTDLLDSLATISTSSSVMKSKIGFLYTCYRDINLQLRTFYSKQVSLNLLQYTYCYGSSFGTIDQEEYIEAVSKALVLKKLEQSATEPKTTTRVMLADIYNDPVYKKNAWFPPQKINGNSVAKQFLDIVPQKVIESLPLHSA